MSAPAVDWSAPWLAPYRAVGERVLMRWQQGASLAQALNDEHSQRAPRFVPQSSLPEGVGHERFVFERNEVPTRDVLHDFFHGLVWLHQPALKRRLNALHLVAPPSTDGRRGPLRDALTLFDENGALLQAPEPLLQAWRARDWHRLFVALRSQWQQAVLTVVGHGLLEQLCRPRKPLTAHVLPLAAPLDEATFAARPFTPLPVLGVPGWWPGNERPGFYDDASVFRPAGSLRSTGSVRPCRS